MLENQIYSIESANINQETLLAINNASKAMKEIHGSLTIEKVDQIMYVLILTGPHLRAVALFVCYLVRTSTNGGSAM